jgi:Protein of unknown function (DUF2829)
MGVASSQSQVQARRDNNDGCAMKFGEALDAIESGARATREGWKGGDKWLRLQVPGADTQMSHPYICLEYPKGHNAHPNGCKVPWLASQSDILAKDWRIIE